MSFFDYLPRLAYSGDLHQHLRGLSTDCSGNHGNAVYQVTTIVIILVSALLQLNYYYGFFNNPRYTHRVVWLLHLLVAGAIAGGIAFSSAASGLPDERHCAELHFSALDCGLFAVTATLYTWLFCFLFSMLFKWKSIANKKIPF